ncbi:CBS domain containing-hemolysin-like protein [Thermovibrio guaymasensis]|uniref:CBS domain containing-hemolysin-like protein n=1 Tax=Thermovibrio guaymasensis TaxID=240167 RepID=A0A420W814_9BACT|nr:hemolysin family protein [Thermovibrio guaymasensis]RKQ63446.1 CBS domain containing-hemolysin-like protein [Thermovibrio guaymasensis]
MEVLFLIFLCVLFEGFFSGSEIAIVSLPRLELQKRLQKGDRAALLLARLLENPEKLLTTTLIGTNLSTVTGSTLFATYFLDKIAEKFPSLASYPELITVIFFTPITLTFGELIPKSLYQKYSHVIAFKIVYPIYFFYLLFKPVSFVVMGIARLIAYLLRSDSEKNPFVTKEELRLLVESAGRVQVERTERDILRNILYLREKHVGDIYTPLSKIIAVSENSTVKEAVDLFLKSGFSKLPVYRDRFDNIVGYLLISDLINVEDPSVSVKYFLRPVVVLPEYMNIFDALKEFRKRKEQLGIVVDEFGSTLGIVTIEDILEEIVGKIEDEFDKEELRIFKQGNEITVDSQVEIDELNSFLNYPLPKGQDYVTLGGLILSKLGRFPRVGEVLELPHHTLKVVSLGERRIGKVKVKEKDEKTKRSS